METDEMETDEFDPDNISIVLHGCCDYEETWHPGITGWGETDAESRASGCVSVDDYDRLLALYKDAKAQIDELISQRDHRADQLA